MPDRVTTIYFQSIGLFTLAIGSSMAIQMEHILIVVSSLATGSLLGEWWNLEKRAECASDYLKHRYNIRSEHVTEGLATSYLLFGVGSLNNIGAIAARTGGSPVVL